VRRLLILALPAVLVLAASARAGLPCGKCQTRCIEPPEDCPNCPCPCEKRLKLCPFDKGHANKYIEKLNCEETCCVRIKAVKKLGSRLHADFCDDPEVLEALISALFYDPCWLVRRAAAWSIYGQRAYTDEALLALYISSKLDPHNLVRARAAEAIDLLTLCRHKCYKDLYAFGDKVIVELRAKKFVPGKCDARETYALVDFVKLGAPPRCAGNPITSGALAITPDATEGMAYPGQIETPAGSTVYPGRIETTIIPPTSAEVLPIPVRRMPPGQ